jgi:hypothetical protein
MDWLPTVGIVVAILSGLTGVVLGVYNLMLARKQSQRRITVKIEDKGFIMSGGIVEANLITVTAFNPGFVPVILNEAGFLLPNRSKVTTLNPIISPRSPISSLLAPVVTSV